MADAVLRELGVNNGGRISFDRSRVRILLCDPSSSQDAGELLRRCSYQVIAVQNARQVMEVLRAGMAQVDLILAEVELPNKRGFKMLKHIMKEEQLKQIPVVMMSSRDEMAVVGKCLRLGAADYLVKPLRTNELLNLWTHMWRRRRMLGLTEKNLISGSLNVNDRPLDVLFADTSESNTTSTDFISEDSNDQARRTIMDCANSRLANSNDQARRNVMDGANNKLANSCSQSATPPVLELTLKRTADLAAVDLNQISSGSERVCFSSKRTELRTAESSAFLSYSKFCSREIEKPLNKPSTLCLRDGDCDNQQLVQAHGASERSTDWQPRLPKKCADATDNLPNAQTHTAVLSIPGVERPMDLSTSHWETVNNTREGSNPNANVYITAENRLSSHGSGCSSFGQMRTRFPQPPLGQLPMLQMHRQNESLMGVPTIPSFAPSHHLPPSMVASNLHPSALLSSSLHLYHGLEALAPGIPSIHSLPPNHVLGPPTAYSYYPMSLPIGQPNQLWSPMPSMPASERTLEKAERREAALCKFRQKRKDRCFEKKIRYVSRKRLAEQRPRNRGQFVRRNNGSEVCGGGGVDESEEDDEEEDDEEERC